MLSKYGPGADPLRAEDFEAVVGDLEIPLGRFLAQMLTQRALAEDVLQETFCIAWRARAKMPAPKAERRAWMYRIARNEALHALRKQRRGRRALEALTADAVDDRQQLETSLAMRDLLAQTLRATDRSLFPLRYVHGFSSRELAEMTGLQPAAVRKRLERSARTLSIALNDPIFAEEGQQHEHTAIA
jgi:RNA polymerase sigma-70 factor, ECF subfamily